MIYELDNPSDPITLEAEDDKVAIVAALAIGGGNYGLTNAEGESVLPIFLLATREDLENWLEESGIQPQVFISEHRPQIVHCLRTTMVGSLHERRAFLVGLGRHPLDPEQLKRWNEERRSSMNDIAGYAHKLADAFEQAGKAEG